MHILKRMFSVNRAVQMLMVVWQIRHFVIVQLGRTLSSENDSFLMQVPHDLPPLATVASILLI